MLALISRYLSPFGKRRSSCASRKADDKMGEDVKMVSIFNEEDLQQEFEAFAVTIDLTDKPVVDKLKTLCLVNDLSPEDLACEWIAFCSRRGTSNALTPAMLEVFEAEHFRKKVIAVREKQKEAEFEEKQPNATASLDEKALKGYGLDQLNTSERTPNAIKNEPIDENYNLEIKSSANPVKAATKVTIESPTKNSSIQVRKALIDQVTGLPVPDRIESTFGVQLTNDQWANKSPINLTTTVRPFNADFHITQPFKYLQMRRHECNLIMNEAIEETADRMIRQLDLAGFSNLNQAEKVEKLYIGRVVSDHKDGQINAKSLYFSSPPFGDGHVRLNMNNCPSFSLFPGKIVALNGTLAEDQLAVKEILHESAVIPEFSSNPITLKAPLQMIAACGPYTLPDSQNLTPLVHLLEHVKVFQPHYLILMGPFFDCRSDYLLINSDCEQFFKIVMDAISTALQNIRTQAIILPSTFDLNSYSTFPAPSFQCSASRIHFMPNPSFLNIEGVIISLSSVDVIRHMLRELVENGCEEGNRIKRACFNLLNQRSLYPLFPPNPEVNLEYSKIDFIRFNVTPHLFIMPSMLKTFALDSNSSVFINPGFSSKGSFARIRVNPPPTNYTGPLNDQISVEILKYAFESK